MINNYISTVWRLCLAAEILGARSSGQANHKIVLHVIGFYLCSDESLHARVRKCSMYSSTHGVLTLVNPLNRPIVVLDLFIFYLFFLYSKS